MTIVDTEVLKDQFEEEWLDAQDHCCSCHVAPPCSFCVNGYSLSMEEFVELKMEEVLGPDIDAEYERVDTAADNYDRAMKGLF